MQTHRSYDEIRVCDGAAEQTGEQFDRSLVRRSKTCTGSLPELLRKARLAGDGTYYLPLNMWPVDTKQIAIRKPWVVVSTPPFGSTVSAKAAPSLSAVKESSGSSRGSLTGSSSIETNSLPDRRSDEIGDERRRVLIVDDDPSIRRLLVAFTRSHGFSPLEARNGREALAAMRAGEADIVIMDLKMPEVSGRDVLCERASDPALMAIPVIVVTASDVRGLMTELAGNNVRAVVAKPFDLAPLLTSLQACFEVVHTPAAA